MFLVRVFAVVFILAMLKISSASLLNPLHTRLLKFPLWSTSIRGRRGAKLSTSRSQSTPPSSEVRVRFAPSPTGSLHIGGARTALFNWLYARKYGGKFIVRVEDTDEARSTRASEESIIRDITWLGLNIDEGPGIGGDCGPYRQSERKEIYKAYADQLIKSGHAYPCFCTSEELQKKKEANAAVGKPNTYDGQWRDRDPVEVEKLIAAGTPYTIRFKVPDKKFFINDLVRGRVVWNPSIALGDFIILRSNGMPVYNFCVAIDDYLMKISHVIRAEEHLSNTIKQILIFDALKAKHPEYAHCSLILGSDRTKLSKRHGAASLSDFEAKGYYPSALRNYLAMLGWNSGTNKEIYTDSELKEAFDVNRIVKSPAVFDTTRLNWINSQHISLLPEDVFVRECENALRNSSIFPLTPINQTDNKNPEVASLEKEFIHIASSLAKKSLKFIDDVVPLTKTILRYPFDDTRQEKRGIKTVSNENFLLMSQKFIEDYEKGSFPHPIVDSVHDFTSSYDAEEFSAYLNKTADEVGVPTKQSFFPSRLALTGSLSGPDIGWQLRLLEITSKLMQLLPDSVLNQVDVDFIPLDRRIEQLRSNLEARKE